MTTEEAQARYRAAMERRDLIEAEWVELGRPLLGKGGATGAAVVPHPLVRMLQEADALCDRLGKSVRVRDVGRPTGSSSAPDRSPRRVKLKAVVNGNGDI